MYKDAPKENHSYCWRPQGEKEKFDLAQTLSSKGLSIMTPRPLVICAETTKSNGNHPSINTHRRQIKETRKKKILPFENGSPPVS